MLSLLSWRSPLLRHLCQKPWPTYQAIASSLDASKPTEEERSPYYDPVHFYPARLGEVLNNRYQIATKLGFGARSTVWLARDLNQWAWSDDRYVAIKINATGARETSPQHELDMHRHITRVNCRHGGWEFVRQLRDSFAIRGVSGAHVCLVFEPLREPLLFYKRRFRDGVIPSAFLKIMIQMILQGLDYLHSECRVIHTDLTPGNILVALEDKSLLEIAAREEYVDPLPQKHLKDGRIVYQSRSNYGPLRDIKGLVEITDLGLAVSGEQSNIGPIGAEIYRAPEVILDVGYSYSADIWALGVMLWDSIEGKDLFHECEVGKYDDEKHLAYITALLGPPPRELLNAGRRTAKFYTPEGNHKHHDLMPASFNFEDALSQVKGEEKKKFIDFVRRMIKWRPEERSTAKELLNDPYLRSG